MSWSLSPYPDGRRFAFTLVHDADGAYSRRLAPLFEVFDSLNLKLTVTAFTLWAAWAHGGGIWDEWPAGSLEHPMGVPLEDGKEREFYLGLARNGHEIAMHAASETSDTRQSLSRAFDLFEELFGKQPLYVEHSSANNLDAQVREGSEPDSPYFNQDLLRQRCRWVWLDDPHALADQGHPSFYDIQACHGSPLRASQVSFGLTNAFRRSGRWGWGNGDGFLEVYTEERILELERNRGLALVYTHLQEGWRDAQSGHMRQEIRARLEFLASRCGWFAPAGVILDRLQALEQIQLGAYEVRNEGSQRLSGLTLVSPEGEMRVFGDLAPGESLRYASG